MAPFFLFQRLRFFLIEHDCKISSVEHEARKRDSSKASETNEHGKVARRPAEAASSSRHQKCEKISHIHI
jgi:hypothetical protein